MLSAALPVQGFGDAAPGNQNAQQGKAGTGLPEVEARLEEEERVRDETGSGYDHAE